MENRVHRRRSRADSLDKKLCLLLSSHIARKYSDTPIMSFDLVNDRNVHLF